MAAQEFTDKSIKRISKLLENEYKRKERNFSNFMIATSLP
jgi:hypothetical protein